MFWINWEARKKLLQWEELDMKDDPKIAFLRSENLGSEDHMLCSYGGIPPNGNTGVSHQGILQGWM